MRRAVVAAMGGGVLMLAATGCTSSTAVPDPSTPDPMPSALVSTSPPSVAPVVGGVFEWGDGTALDAVDIDPATASLAVAGTDYSVVYTVPAGSQDVTYLVPLALRSDGTLVAEQVPPHSYDGGQWLTKSSTVGVFDGTSFAPFTGMPTIAGDHPRQAYAAAAQDDTVAWAETDSTDLYQSTWRMFSADAHGRVHLVARAEEIKDGGLPYVDGDSTPVLIDGRMYWATAAPTGDTSVEEGAEGSYRMDVVSRAPDGSGPLVVEATGVAQPAGNASGTYVVRSAMDDPDVAADTVTVERVTGDGATHVLLRWTGAVGGHLTGLRGDGDQLVFATTTETGSGGAIYVVDTRAQTARRIALRSSGRSASLALCTGRLQWSEADAEGQGRSEPTYVLDLASHGLARIDVDNAFSGAMCGGGFLAWSQLEAGAGTTASTVVARWTPHG